MAGSAGNREGTQPVSHARSADRIRGSFFFKKLSDLFGDSQTIQDIFTETSASPQIISSNPHNDLVTQAVLASHCNWRKIRVIKFTNLFPQVDSGLKSSPLYTMQEII